MAEAPPEARKAMGQSLARAKKEHPLTPPSPSPYPPPHQALLESAKGDVAALEDRLTDAAPGEASLTGKVLAHLRATVASL